jgi:uncharacterized NAD(P)/FAD-binding protein YdhS
MQRTATNAAPTALPHATLPHELHERPQARNVAIIGGGFSGTALSVRLLERARELRLNISLIEPRLELGAGVAYSTRDYPYPLNVAAGQMSIDPAKPLDFLEHLRGQGIDAQPVDYLPRQVYGEYLRARLEAARANKSDSVQFSHRRARVLQLKRAPEGGFVLWLDDGSAAQFDDVVLAIGNPPPAELAAIAPIAATPHYVKDPWSIGELAGTELDSVLLVGSGLTMIDAALRLAAIRPRVRHIHVLSRHGLLPQPQAREALPAIKPNLGNALASAQGSTRALMRALRKAADEVMSAGGDWREVFALVRSLVPALWQGLDRVERARFLRHARAYWDVHRHRVPVGPLGAVQSLQRAGVLEVHAGHLDALRVVDSSVEVLWRPRGGGTQRAWLVDRVINCTGPDHRADRNTDPLVQSLLGNGVIQRDDHALGVETAPDGRVIGNAGAALDGLYYLGPWLRARDWEGTAVPELRTHALTLADALIARASAAVAARVAR